MLMALSGAVLSKNKSQGFLSAPYVPSHFGHNLSLIADSPVPQSPTEPGGPPRRPEAFPGTAASQDSPPSLCSGKLYPPCVSGANPTSFGKFLFHFVSDVGPSPLSLQCYPGIIVLTSQMTIP